MEKKLSIIIPVYNQETLIIRALDSIPIRNDIEIIVIDDGSTDDTLLNVINYRDLSIGQKDIQILHNEKNLGVAATVNKGYDNAKGEYIVLLGSDDYFYTEELNKVIDNSLIADLVYFNLEINDGTIFKLSPLTKEGYCGSTKFMKRSFIGNTRCDVNRRAAEDYYFYQELLKKDPSEIFIDRVIKHYNFPREGSLSDLVKKGKINIE